MGRDGASSLFYIQVSLLCDCVEIPPGLKVRMVMWVRSGICSVSVIISVAQDWSPLY